MPLSFPCRHCQAENQVEDALIGCVVSCAGCGRSIIAPLPNAGVVPMLRPHEAHLPRRAFVTVGFAFGLAALLGVVASGVALFFERTTVGMENYHVLLAGIVAAVIGATLGGIVGWR